MKLKNVVILCCVAIAITVTSIVLDAMFIYKVFQSANCGGSLYNEPGVIISIAVASVFVGAGAVFTPYFTVNAIKTLRRSD